MADEKTKTTVDNALEVNFARDFVDKRSTAPYSLVQVTPPTPPPVRRRAVRTKDQKKFVGDSFYNFVARLGIQADNLSSQNYYNLGPYISRNRIELEAAYRENWLVGKIIDCVAEDMTREGIIMYSELSPDDVQKLQVALSTYGIWHDIASGIKWGRLYGGALAVMLIDGADYSKPLDIEAIGKNKFKGLMVLDRWMVQPSMGDLITDLTKDIGKPKYYDTLPGVASFPSTRLHHTRVLRFEGIELPYYQRLFENLWGLSVVERILDRLMAFDSATLGAAQLLYKAYLRVVGVEGLRDALAMGGKQEEAVIRQFMYIRAMQNNEGITVLDSKDQFHTHTYSFSGISDILQQFGQQISGGEGIPLIRLFGQSPAGFSTGDADIRNYYDEIARRQENVLRPQLDKLLAVMSMSVLGKALPEDFEFKFAPLWQMSDYEKAQIAQMDSDTIASAVESGLISKSTGLKELVQLSRVTGRFTNITKEDIEEAENEPPLSGMLLPGKEDEGEREESDGVFVSGLKQPSGEKEEKSDENSNSRLGGNDPDLIEEDSEQEAVKERHTFKDVFEKRRDCLNRARDAINRARKVLDEFKESEHPRAKGGPNAGQFVKKGQEGVASSSKSESKAEKKHKEEFEKKEKSKPKSGNMLVSKIVKGKRVGADGKALPKHIAAVRIPPAWQNVTYNPDPEASLLVTGVDQRGQRQYIYSEKYRDKKNRAKFARVRELNKNYDKIMQENAHLMKGVLREEATVLALIAQTGMRPGSNKELKAAKKAYGATTLEGRHVTVNKDKTVTLNFVGKKGVENSFIVTDRELCRDIIRRMKKAGPDGKLFDCDNIELLRYTSDLDGKNFRPKDFRTLVGTRLAMDAIRGKAPPQHEKEYKKMVKAVARHVAKKLGNTPGVALKAYIDPVVFIPWKNEIGG